MKRGLALCMAVATMCAVATVTADETSETSDRYAKKIALRDNQTIVVAEGDFEARSIGSYSVRLYAANAAQPLDTTFYEAGVLVPRDGGIEDVRLADIDGDKRDEVIVIVRSAGSGGYLSAQAFSVSNKRIEARAKVADLPPDADPVAALNKTNRTNKTMGKGKYHDPNAGAR